MAKTKLKRTKDSVFGKTNAHLLVKKKWWNLAVPPSPFAEHNAYA